MDASTVMDTLLTVMGYAQTAVRETTRIAGPRLYALSQSHPDLTSIFMLLAILWVSMSILTRAGRFMYSTVVSTIKMAIFSAVVAFVWAIVQKGHGLTREDVMEILQTAYGQIIGSVQQFIPGQKKGPLGLW
ncbi:hypothetical protein YB2330_001274 [Saitoella coloradoensis]